MLHPKEKILLCANALWFLAEGMLGPIFGVFGASIGGTILDITWAWSLYLITLGLFVIVIGRISDYVSKEKLLIAGYIMNTALTFSYLLVTTKIHLFAVQIGIGIATALSTPTWYALYSQFDDQDKSGFLWGLSSGFNNICSGIAILGGGFIVTHYSYHVLFWFMGVVQLVATVVTLGLVRSRATHEYAKTMTD